MVSPRMIGMIVTRQRVKSVPVPFSESLPTARGGPGAQCIGGRAGMVSRPRRNHEEGVRRILPPTVLPQNASDAFRRGGTSEAEIQAAAATLGAADASLRRPAPRWPV